MPRRYLLSIDSGGIRGERLAEQIDWEAILSGTETRFQFGSHNTLWEQYKVQTL